MFLNFVLEWWHNGKVIGANRMSYKDLLKKSRSTKTLENYKLRKDEANTDISKAKYN